MILSALASYFDILRKEHPDEIPPRGWSYVRVGSVLVLSQEGAPRSVIPLSEGSAARKLVPEHPGRTSAPSPYLLCDTAEYLLGVDSSGASKRALRRFELARERHLELLSGVDSACARAICSYFATWDPASARQVEAFSPVVDDPGGSGNLLLAVSDSAGRITYASEDAAIADAWDNVRDQMVASSEPAVCLASGEEGPVAKLHPKFQGVPGAQSSGAALVSFNKQAFESYGKEQGGNAPVSQKLVDEYGAVLTYLLRSERHRVTIGNTRVVFWSPVASELSSELMVNLLAPPPPRMQSDDDGARGNGDDIEELLHEVLSKVSAGRYVDIDGIDPKSPFYVLGLSGNAGRLSVRLFLRDEFGNLLLNLLDHYRITDVAHAAFQPEHVFPSWLLKSIENPNAKDPVISPLLSGGLLRAILQGTRYPESMYENALMRCRAERGVTRERAAIIRGCLIRNHNLDEEELTMALNEGRTTTPYLLGRAFALLEQIQEEANGVETISSRYLDSACTTPARVFPVLLKLENAHMKKLMRDNRGLAIHLTRQLDSVLSSGSLESFPRQLDIVEQGEFLLALHQQRQKRYEKKGTDGSAEAVDQEA